jgi:undecaprenyl diphosphate synthase
MIQHLAIVMDGNRRWAQKNKMNILLGHSKGGIDAVKRTVEFCLTRKISYLSLYTFSLENLKRTEQEKSYLFNLMVSEGDKSLQEFVDKEIRIKFVGDRSLFPKAVLKTCKRLEEQTKNFSKLTINILFCYGARQEILYGIKSLYHKIKMGLISEEDISEKSLNDCLWTQGTPEPELVIRTGGRKRLSNFLLFQSAYSEFYFLDCLWPEVQEEDLQNALNSFTDVTRNFGV